MNGTPGNRSAQREIKSEHQIRTATVDTETLEEHSETTATLVDLSHSPPVYLPLPLPLLTRFVLCLPLLVRLQVLPSHRSLYATRLG